MFTFLPWPLVSPLRIFSSSIIPPISPSIGRSSPPSFSSLCLYYSIVIPPSPFPSFLPSTHLYIISSYNLVFPFHFLISSPFSFYFSRLYYLSYFIFPFSKIRYGVPRSGNIPTGQEAAVRSRSPWGTVR